MSKMAGAFEVCIRDKMFTQTDLVNENGFHLPLFFFFLSFNFICNSCPTDQWTYMDKL